MVQPVSLPIYWGNPKTEGSRYVDFDIPIRSQGSPQYLSVSIPDITQFSSIRGYICDNTRNGQDIYLTVADTGQAIQIPAYCYCQGPLYTGSSNPTFKFDAVSTLANPINDFDFKVTNFELPEKAIYTTNNLTANGATPVEFAEIIPAGSWNRLLGVNPQRKGFNIVANRGWTIGDTVFLGWGSFSAGPAVQPDVAFATIYADIVNSVPFYERHATARDVQIPTTSLWAFFQNTGSAAATISISVNEENFTFPN